MRSGKWVKRRGIVPMNGSMSDVEALLSVDAGRIPPGTLAFFRKNADSSILRARAVLSGLLGIAAVTTALAGGSRVLAALLLIGAGLAAVLATPTLPADGEDELEDEVTVRPQVMVVTPEGLIGRDEFGLRSWRFEELSTVFTGGHAERPHLVLVDRKGKRHALDYLRYSDGERLREIIAARLRPG